MEVKSVLSAALPNHNCFEGKIVFLTTEKSREQAKIVQKMVNTFFRKRKARTKTMKMARKRRHSEFEWHTSDKPI